MRARPSDLVGKRVRIKRSAVRATGRSDVRTDLIYMAIAAGDSTVTLAHADTQPVTVHVSEVEVV